MILVKDLSHMVELILNLKVRGAPAIGISSGLFLNQLIKEGVSREQYQKCAKTLREVRPTAVNLMVVIDELLCLSYKEKWQELCYQRGLDFFHEDVELCQKMGEIGAELIEDGDHVLTHCNTGGLATAGIGTALGVIKTAYDQGKKIHVYVDETRPLLQGGRLSTYELEKWGIPYTLICDNMAAQLMSQNKVDKIFVGSDRIALSGDFANKIGTYSLAVLAHFHKVPLYAVAPYTSIDFELSCGSEILIEQRADSEVRGVRGSFGDVCWAPKNAKTYNPAFDVTPVKLYEGLVTEKKFYSKDDLLSGALSHY